MQVFWKKGYQATSVQDLVEATGLQRGSLYGAFGNKHELYLEALGAYADATLDGIGKLIRDSEDPVDGLRQFIRNGGVQSQSATAARRGCLIGNTCSELVAHDTAVRERVASFLDDMQSTMAGALRDGQALGTFDATRDPEAVTRLLQCSMQGLALLARSRPGPEVIRGVIDEVLRILD